MTVKGGDNSERFLYYYTLAQKFCCSSAQVYLRNKIYLEIFKSQKPRMPGRTKAQDDASSHDADMQDVPPSAQEEISQDAEMREDAEAEEEEEEEIETQRVRIVRQESGMIGRVFSSLIEMTASWLNGHCGFV